MPPGPWHHRENPIEAPGTPLGRHVPGPGLVGLVSAFRILPTSDVSPHGTRPGAQRLRGVRKETPPTRILSLAANLQRRVVTHHPSAHEPWGCGHLVDLPGPSLGGFRRSTATAGAGRGACGLCRTLVWLGARPARGRGFPRDDLTAVSVAPRPPAERAGFENICWELGVPVSPSRQPPREELCSSSFHRRGAAAPRRVSCLSPDVE